MAHIGHMKSAEKLQAQRSTGATYPSDTPASAKLAMPVWHSSAERTMLTARHAPEPSPSRMPRSNSGASAERREQAAMAGLGRDMRGERMGEPAGIELLQRRDRRRADKTVEQHRHLAMARGERRADDRGKLAPAECGRNLQRIAEHAPCAAPGPFRSPPSCASARRRRRRCRARPISPARRRTAPPRSLPPSWCCRCPSRRSRRGRCPRPPRRSRPTPPSRKSASLIAGFLREVAGRPFDLQRHDRKLGAGDARRAG